MCRFKLTLLGLFIFLFYKAQDFIYFKDGTKKEAKILEIYTDRIIISDSFNIPDEIETSNIVLIQFKNKTTQLFNLPNESIKTYKNKTLQHYEFNNSIGFNVAALALGDVNIYLGTKFKNKKIDINSFGAYNISNRVTIFNNKFSNFSFAKRLAEFGTSINYNFIDYNSLKKHLVFIGFLFKQTYFQYHLNNNTVNIVQYNSKTTVINTFIIQYGVKYKPTKHLLLSSSLGVGVGKIQDSFYKDLIQNSNSKKFQVRAHLNLNVAYLFK